MNTVRRASSNSTGASHELRSLSYMCIWAAGAKDTSPHARTKHAKQIIVDELERTLEVVTYVPKKCLQL